MTFEYRGEYTNEISFPLGGIGSGSIGLAGDGRLKDWEIFNRPNKGSVNGFSHFAIKAEGDGKVKDARVLNGDLAPPYAGELTGEIKHGFGFGPRRENLAGVPHFRETEFVGEFPMATIRYLDDHFPGEVSLTAFNPFIPLNDKDSSLPAAFFEFRVVNTTGEPLNYSLAGTLTNPAEAHNSRHDCVRSGKTTVLTLNAPATDAGHPHYGGLAIGTDSTSDEEVGYQQYWYRGRWFDGLGVYWRDFGEPGLLKNRCYDSANKTDTRDSATLERRITLNPGEEGRVRFIISWYYPNCYNYWSEGSCDCDADSSCDCSDGISTWKNYYATLFKDADEVVSYAIENWDELQSRTEAFKNTLFSSSLPSEVIDAVSANISILKTPTALRLTDGSFYGFEGCDQCEGCCEGSCSHVWNYAYALPYLFPKLERSMRDLEFQYNQRDDGQLTFRLQLPLGSPRWGFRACADGQFGGVLKVYREWKISGDDRWLTKKWSAVKRAIEFAWAPTNEDRWDPEQSGVLTGRQHHTLDMELFGPNSWLNGFYLAALKAGTEMAEQNGDEEAAALYREIFQRGKEWTDRELFNGTYYHQKLELGDKGILESFHNPNDTILKGGDIFDAYWDDEHNEIKYQILEGCGIDQVLAQWHANLIGLGEIFDPSQTKSALQSIYRYNYKPSMRYFFNPCRTFCLNDEAGTVICDWPEGKYKPFVPVPYAEETMHGYEYQAACHMIQEGLVDEGLEIVRGVRDRYDGRKRNPWNEIECGSNYARSMASYALLLTYLGFGCDMSNGELSFDPVLGDSSEFSSFWSVSSAWGTFTVSEQTVTLGITEGAVELSILRLPFMDSEPSELLIEPQDASANLERNELEDVDISWDHGIIRFGSPITISEGARLTITR